MQFEAGDAFFEYDGATRADYSRKGIHRVVDEVYVTIFWYLPQAKVCSFLFPLKKSIRTIADSFLHLQLLLEAGRRKPINWTRIQYVVRNMRKLLSNDTYSGPTKAGGTDGNSMDIIQMQTCVSGRISLMIGFIVA